MPDLTLADIRPDDIVRHVFHGRCARVTKIGRKYVTATVVAGPVVRWLPSSLMYAEPRPTRTYLASCQDAAKERARTLYVYRDADTLEWVSTVDPRQVTASPNVYIVTATAVRKYAPWQTWQDR